MKNTRIFIVLLALGLAAFACRRGESTGAQEFAPPYSPYVEAFTYGTVSRTAPVYLILNQEIEPEKQTEETLRKAFKIRPSVSGQFRFENGKTVVFRPETELKRAMTYTVTADMGMLFGATGDDKTFAFGFTTQPFAVRGSLGSLDANPAQEDAYDITLNLYTADREEAATVEGVVDFSEKVTAEWTHDPDGRQHRVKLTGVPAGKSSARTLMASVGANKLGAPHEEIVSVYVPAATAFEVYDVAHATEPERYVEVTFTRPLDPAQPMRGLAFIDGNESETVRAEGNKLRLYPDAGRASDLTVRLDASIRSANGMTLGEDVVRVVEAVSELPNVRFIGSGVIVPQSDRLLVPFQAVYLRGVIVRVIRIMERNIGQFLQENQLDGDGGLMRVGRLVARKTVFFDDAEQSPSRWGTYAVDLKSLMDPEPGAIYRVELSFSRDLSAYPCDGADRLSREQILAQDEVKFRTEMNLFDQGGYYFYDEGSDEGAYRWEERDDPCKPTFYHYKTFGRNVLATNLGLMAKAGDGNEWRVFVFNLLNAQPEKGVEVKLYNFQHQELGTGLTDDRGQTRVAASGKPYYAIARQGAQRSYLRVDPASALSLSSFDVSGEVVQQGIKGFIYGERGVWRPGDDIHLSFMLNDRAGTLPAEHPVTMELYNPLGQLYQRKTLTHGTLGIYAFDMATDADAPTGAWEVRVQVGGATFTRRIRIETIKPNRLKIDLSFGEGTLLSDRPIRGDLRVEWLTGAVARNLKYEIEATFQPVKTNFEKFVGFVFDDPSKRFEQVESGTISGVTDERGNAVVSGRFETGNNAPGMLSGVFNTRVFEESGDFSIDALRVLWSPYETYAGIRSPQQGRTQLDTGVKHTFEAASVDYTGKVRPNARLRVRVYKVNWYWWWSASQERLANYISNRHDDPVQSFDVTTRADGKGTFDLQFPNDRWGTYYVQVSDPQSGHSSGVLAYFDWPSGYGRREAGGSDAAMRLSFTTDKDTYAPGEKMTLTIPSSAGSLAVVSVESGTRVLDVSQHACRDGETRVTLPVTADMQPNVYVHVTLLQPHAMTANDLPIRMYGVIPVVVTDPKSRLHPVIATSAEIKPESRYEVTVSEQNGREMAYTLAIVDEGLLDLTRFRTPDPWAVFNAREALGVRTWDMYNYVVGAYGGRIEQLFSIGGDDALNAGPKASVNRFKPVVQFDGPFILKKGAKKKHAFTMPNYNGRVRVMVVAGDGRAYGNAEKSVLVRKPVMLLGTLPRVIGVNEEMVVPATVFATEAGVGEVTVSIACSDNMEVVGEARKTLRFTEITDKTATFRIRVKGKPGAGKVTLTAASLNDKSTYETDIEIRSVRRPQVRVTPAALGAGETWNRAVEMPGAAGTNKLTLEVSNVQPLNLASRLGFLLGYPHGCIEQTTSKGFPQLYVGQFASLTRAQADGAEAAVKEVLRRLRSFQTGSGAFAYWPGGTDANAWATIYATHFMLEAEKRGYPVNDAMRKNVLNNLRQVARGWKPARDHYRRSEELTQAYRLYVLALSGSPEVGAMNRLRENAALDTMARWMLAAGYALAGHSDVANALTNRTVDMNTYLYNQYDNTFGSDLRDRSIRLMTLCLLDSDVEAAALAAEISARLSSDSWFSTQSTAFALLAMSRFIDRYQSGQQLEFSYEVGRKSETVKTPKHIWSELLAEGAGVSVPVQVKNGGKGTLFVRVIAEGTPEQGNEEAYANGLQLHVRFEQGGRGIDVSELEQGTNFTAVATVRNPTASTLRHIVLTQIFPSGWEILNNRLTGEGADTYSPGVDYQDIRDDRVYTHMDRLPSGREVTVRINLSATYAGVFYHPPVYAEAMYDHTTRANTTGQNVTVK